MIDMKNVVTAVVISAVVSSGSWLFLAGSASEKLNNLEKVPTQIASINTDIALLKSNSVESNQFRNELTEIKGLISQSNLMMSIIQRDFNDMKKKVDGLETSINDLNRIKWYVDQKIPYSDKKGE